MSDRIATHLHVLVEDIGARPAGSDANRRATEYIHAVLEQAGLDVELQGFSCLHWQPGEGWLTLPNDDVVVPVAPNPFSRRCDIAGPVVRLSRREELGDAVPQGSVLVLSGELSREPVMPKRFPFFNSEDHQALVAYLESREPAAVIAVAPSDDAHQPVFDDADLMFPSTTVPPAVGERITPGADVQLRLGGSILPGEGANVIGRGGGAGLPIVLSAHLDSKVTTPGAFDNAGGVATLLALAEGGLPAAGAIHLVFFNGEDHYANPGEQAYLAATDLGSVRLNVNLDGAGVVGRRSTAAALSCPERLERLLGELVHARQGWTVVAPWHESDHSLFAMAGVPSVAITSEHVHDLFARVAHTPADRLDLVDPAALAGVCCFVADFVRAVAQGPGGDGP